MKTRLLSASLLLAWLASLVLGLTGTAMAQENRRPEPAVVSQPVVSAGLTLDSIFPASFANGVNMPVTISGSNLDTVKSARLGTVALRSVQVISSTQVTALVPWSIAPGGYDLIITDSNELTAILPAAVTVTAAVTDWTSHGPYGGKLYEVVLDPVHPSRLYVSADRSGLYKTQDGGANWDFSLIRPFTGRVQMAYPTPGQPPALYVGGDGGMGMMRSMDYGQTWVQKVPAEFDILQSAGGAAVRAFVRPNQVNAVYLGVVSRREDNDPLAGLYTSPDLGETWAILTGTSRLPVSTVAFDPDHPDLNLVLGTTSGQVYTSTDDGVTWTNPITLGTQIGELQFAPTLYNGWRSLWATPCNTQLDCFNQYTVYTSTDVGQTWTPIVIAPGAPNYGVAFHDSIPGLMWAAVGSGYYSEDGGATWQPLGAGLHEAHGFAVVPGATTRQTTTLFAATQNSLYKSTDGGDTWAAFDTGIGGNLARTIAISPFNADEAFVATQATGVLRTFDGGRSWQSLPIPIGRYDAPIAADPFTDGKVYFGNYNAGLPPAVRVSTDHGSTVTEHLLTLPPEYAGQSADVEAIAPDPETPNRLLGGVCPGGDSGFGLIYASTDGGVTWEMQTTPAGIKCIKRLVFDPHDVSVVYAGSNGSGVLRSTNGGATWSLLAHQSAGTQVWALVIDPRDSRSIYTAAFGGNGSDVGVFATHDGGDTWVNMTGCDYPIWELKFVRVGMDYWLYAATMNGLRYLKTIPADPATPWQIAGGIAGVAATDGFNAATEDGRVVYYIGTSGGTVPSGSVISGQALGASASQNLAGGVYRRMDRFYMSYLPLARR